jgi:hypothetical protein
MKTKYLILIFALAFKLSAYAQQVPNTSFEIWTNPKNPDGWYTFSSASIVNMASMDTSNKVDGLASARLRSTTIGGSTTHEVLSLGTATFSFVDGYSFFPIYFPFRPDSLLFAYKFDSPGIDTATAYINLSNGNMTLIETELDLVKNPNWSFLSIPLTALYPNADIPDSILIQFKSSKVRDSFFGIDGSTLHVDDVRLGYVSVVSSLVEYSEIKPNIFPNPFSSQITINLLGSDQTNLTLYDILGQKILEQTFVNYTTVNTAQFPIGVYYYELRSNKGECSQGKVVKH